MDSFTETSRPAKSRRKRKGAAGGGGPGGGGGGPGGAMSNKKRSPGPNFSLASQVSNSILRKPDGIFHEISFSGCHGRR